MTLAPIAALLFLIQTQPAALPDEETVRRAAAAAAIAGALGPQRSQEDFERDQLSRAGLPSLSDAAEAGRDVWQVSLNDPYFMFAVPAIQIERTGQAAELTILRRDGLVLTRALTEEDMRMLEGTDPFQPYPRAAAGPVTDGPPPIRHTWIARIGQASAGHSRTTSASDEPRWTFVVKAVRLALRSRPECDQAEGQDPSFAFHRCFGTKPS
ncbi:hypothetical protein BZG35_15200 [Brevundimonas sp. LM2]|uniref:hypothetical protein n=1 Tax=Brevundimonas sp. LM2 TaxID=1938605 RepID=UPI000983BDE9|nr:hypothetical protein [Brevundimonas sp. LM2]AQR62851.1 hypothetical protein BZG35_15200 [Brevundimonas sp. LM2]